MYLCSHWYVAIKSELMLYWENSLHFCNALTSWSERSWVLECKCHKSLCITSFILLIFLRITFWYSQWHHHRKQAWPLSGMSALWSPFNWFCLLWVPHYNRRRRLKGRHLVLCYQRKWLSPRTWSALHYQKRSHLVQCYHLMFQTNLPIQPHSVVSNNTCSCLCLLH